MSLKLEALLDQTRDVLIKGDLQGLADMAAAVAEAADNLPRLDRAAAERLRRKADRNATLLKAATRGVRAAGQRLAEFGTGPSLTTYDATGRRAVLPGPFGPEPRRA